MKRKIIMILSLLVIILMGYFIWSKQPNKNAFMPPKSVVKVDSVKIKDMPTWVRSLGTLQASHSAEIASEIEGMIEAIPFADGAMVKQGDLLVKLADNIQEAKLQQAAAQKKLKEVDFDRLKALKARGAVSTQDFDKSEADLKVAEAEMTLAQAELDKTFIKAPFDGQLGSTPYSVGQYVTPGMPLVSLVDKSLLDIQYSVPQQYLDKLKLGAEVTFSTAAYPNEQFIGIVNYISPSVDVATRTIMLEALFDNAQGRLSPGLSGTVQQIILTTPDALIIPEESLVPSVTGYQVYRIVDGKALATSVEIGTRKDGIVQILSGLSQDEVVVVQGHQSLRDGAMVDVMEASQ